METLTEQQNLSRLRWQCRRGMLELDEFLDSFLNKNYLSLTDKHKQTFEQILDLPDQLLLDYLLGQTRPIDMDVADVIQQIRHSARS
ncbi:MAG: succinate dehydrogenase assembly factor 2 [Gammaproteobacteria bacterium]|nr:succinate dehydrogenase assembly factor 2 [Gammaproteobacteria bacterium]